eukprot:3207670-Amphidinium_carterae.1
MKAPTSPATLPPAAPLWSSCVLATAFCCMSCGAWHESNSARKPFELSAQARISRIQNAIGRSGVCKREEELLSMSSHDSTGKFASQMASRLKHRLQTQ